MMFQHTDSRTFGLVAIVGVVLCILAIRFLFQPSWGTEKPNSGNNNSQTLPLAPQPQKPIKLELLPGQKLDDLADDASVQTQIQAKVGQTRAFTIHSCATCVGADKHGRLLFLTIFYTAPDEGSFGCIQTNSGVMLPVEVVSSEKSRFAILRSLNFASGLCAEANTEEINGEVPTNISMYYHGTVKNSRLAVGGRILIPSKTEKLWPIEIARTPGIGGAGIFAPGGHLIGVAAFVSHPGETSEGRLYALPIDNEIRNKIKLFRVE
jgi:hypothetical protein